MGKPFNLSRQTFKKKYPVLQRTSMYSKEFYTKKRLKKKNKNLRCEMSTYKVTQILVAKWNGYENKRCNVIVTIAYF